MLAAEKGQWEVCEKLTELGADLNKSDRVSETCCNCIGVCCCEKLDELGADVNKEHWVRETCCNCIIVCCCIIVVLTFFFFELERQDGLDVGC